MADIQLCGVSPGNHLRNCMEPGTICDPQRGRKVCTAHQPHPVRQKLLNGTLSMELQHLGFISMGHSETCALCGQPITTDQGKAIYRDPNPVAPSQRVYFHDKPGAALCTTIFERERDVIRARCDLPN
jgi:hypothetical protein